MRAMALLAELMADERMSTAELAAAGQMPRKYLEHILRDLKGAGLVRSKPGKQGGYQLARPPVEITAGQIARAVDGEIVPISTDPVGRSPQAESRLTGNLRVLWHRLGQAMTEVLDSTTLDQLIWSPCLGQTTSLASGPSQTPEDTPSYQI